MLALSLLLSAALFLVALDQRRRRLAAERELAALRLRQPTTVVPPFALVRIGALGHVVPLPIRLRDARPN